VLRCDNEGCVRRTEGAAQSHGRVPPDPPLAARLSGPASSAAPLALVNGLCNNNQSAARPKSRGIIAFEKSALTIIGCMHTYPELRSFKPNKNLGNMFKIILDVFNNVVLLNLKTQKVSLKNLTSEHLRL
jgi:hypothetical protein